MPVSLELLIRKTEAKIAETTEPKKLARLNRDLAAYKFSQIKAESDDDMDEDDDEDSKAKKAEKKAEEAKKAAEAAKHRAKAAEFRKRAEEAEEAAKKAEGADEEEEKKGEEAKYAAYSDGAAAALASQADMLPQTIARLEQLERASLERDRSAKISKAFDERRITPAEAKALQSKPMAFVDDFLGMRKHPVVMTEQGALLPNDTHGAQPVQNAEIDKIVAATGLTGDKAAKLRAQLARNYETADTNGVGRY